MSLNPLWPFFHRRDKQNNSHHKTYCKGCVQHYVTDAKLQVPDDLELDAVGEDERLDDRAVEVGSDKEYNG